MFEQAFKNIDDTLRKDAGCSSELDYVEQTSWVLFLKYLDDLEKDKKTAAELAGKTYKAIIDKQYTWAVWAAPKDKDGKIDHQKALSGDDLKEFVDGKLFPYFKKFKHDADHPDTIEYKIGEIFNELKNKIQSGYNLHTVLDMPGGTFQGAGVKTVVLFFDKGIPTRKTWFYQLNLDRNLGKTNPLNENDLADFVKLQKTKADSENSWSVDIGGSDSSGSDSIGSNSKDAINRVSTNDLVSTFDFSTYDLSVKNPRKKDEAKLREPKEILEEMRKLDEEAGEILGNVRRIL